MIVVDASAILELLLNSPAGPAVADRVLDPAESVAAPHLLDIEVLQVLRRYVRAGDLDADRGAQAVEDLTDLPIARYSHDALAPRIWELRHNLTAYDAAYVALAEVLAARLLTRDRRLGGSRGHRATIELL